MIHGVLLTRLSVIKSDVGSVLHTMKNNDPGFLSFGEAYFSEINSMAINAWKRHREMTLNLVVPIGEIRIVLFDDRNTNQGKFQEMILSRKNYCRLTIPPMVWVGIQNLSKSTSIILNIANMPHNINELERKFIQEIKFNWNNQ